ncbi:MAG: DNA-processing protein DprA [Actinobacteria bacterium]|nr:DNA-processing protein DprA [Actinomycetota bacterium]MBW3650262.1 DNA-processing protein DprA [Actinomycetota bacterium]
MTTTDNRDSRHRVPPAAGAVALAALPGCGQRRLRILLSAAAPDQVWDAVCTGTVLGLPGVAAGLGSAGPGLAARWRSLAGASAPAEAWESLRRHGVGVWVVGDGGYPAALAADDPEPPPILFWQGKPEALEGPTVAIVGTRRCTSYGLDVARELGRDLSAAGVSVVSGLAIGIDGAAHEGALAAAGAPPVAVVGSGLDVIYPPRHRPLWRRVAEAGLILSEAPLGAPPEAWRFPERNRIIAALSRVVVVVESHAAGGSLSTVRAASERGITVMAVPGSVRSPSSAGTNRLLADGVAPATDAQDVLVALALEGVGVPGPAAQPTAVPPVEVEGEAADVLAAVDWTPTTTEEILRRTGLPLGQGSAALTRLEVSGLVRRRGSWWERVPAGRV